MWRLLTELAPVPCVLWQAGAEGLVARGDAAGAPVLAEAVADSLVAGGSREAQCTAAGWPPCSKQRKGVCDVERSTSKQ